MEQMTPDLKKKYTSHIASDVMYPASCDQIMAACEGMSEFTSEEKAWFGKTLPHGKYQSAADVNRAVGI
ncbi:MAG: hypothetical protein HY296_04395 [Thaumarchaeota archaeon]|nr:hypothetical protein [Nitrososphaerota archaeon]